MATIKNPITIVQQGGGGGGIVNSTLKRVYAGSTLQANMFVGYSEMLYNSQAGVMAIPGAYSEYFDNNGTIEEGSIACAVAWLDESEMLTIASPYNSNTSGKISLEVKSYFIGWDYQNGHTSATLDDTFTFSWYPEHFDTVEAKQSSPKIYSMDKNHFAVSYPGTFTENNVTYTGGFEVFEIDRSNKTISCTGILDIGSNTHVIPISDGSTRILIIPRSGSVYSKYFVIEDGYVTFYPDNEDVQVLDLSIYPDIQAADSYEINLLSAGIAFDQGKRAVAAKVTTTPATSNYICAAVSSIGGPIDWSGRTTVTSFMDYTPYELACSASWDDPSIMVIGQKDSNTLLTLQMPAYDYSSISFVDVQMRNATNGYVYRGGWWGNTAYYYGQFLSYASYYANNQVSGYDMDSQSEYFCDMILPTYNTLSYVTDSSPIYNFYNIRWQQINSTFTVVTKAHVDPVPAAVVGDEVSRCFMNVFGPFRLIEVWQASQGQSAFGVTTSAAEWGDLIDVEVPY